MVDAYFNQYIIISTKFILSNEQNYYEYAVRAELDIYIYIPPHLTSTFLRRNGLFLALTITNTNSCSLFCTTNFLFVYTYICSIQKQITRVYTRTAAGIAVHIEIRSTILQ